MIYGDVTLLTPEACYIRPVTNYLPSLRNAFSFLTASNTNKSLSWVLDA